MDVEVGRNAFEGVRLLYRSTNELRRSIRAFSMIVSIRSAPFFSRD